MKKRITAVVMAGLMVLSTGCSANVSVDPNTGAVTVDGVPVNELVKDIDPNAFVDSTGTEDAGLTDEDGPILPPHLKDGVDVVAVFAGAKAHRVVLPDLPDDIDPPEGADDPLMTDTIWIYYSDNTFDQYAETPTGYSIFGTGTYSFKDDGDFILDGDEDIITIDAHTVSGPNDIRGSKVEVSHEFNLDDLDYVQLYGPDDKGKEIEAIFGDDNQLIYEDEDGVLNHYDSVWLMFKDMSFKQFAFIDDDVELYADGTYEFEDGGDFRFIGIEEDSGKITLNYDYNMHLGKNPKPVTYDIKSLGLTCFYEIMEPDILDDIEDAEDIEDEEEEDAKDAEDAETAEDVETVEDAETVNNAGAAER